MARQKIIRSNLTVKLLIIGASIIIMFIIFFAETKQILANDYFYEVLVREDNISTSTEEISGEQFSINDSDLLANIHNERLNIDGLDIDVSRYVYLEISERGCDVASGLAISAGSAFYIGSFYSVSLPNTPANTITISVNTPTRGRQTVKLESEEGATPESQKTCDKVINSTIEIHNKLNITILKVHQPVQESELELTIQNTWNTFNQQY
ncbi:hypothetical protein [Coleofasciculus sp.]|uniref:hypothetical protein n=1 Tax=Coleofasciculus sp. TaxID=3100458 RepID=UPI0039F8B75B